MIWWFEREREHTKIVHLKMIFDCVLYSTLSFSYYYSGYGWMVVEEFFVSMWVGIPNRLKCLDCVQCAYIHFTYSLWQLFRSNTRVNLYGCRPFCWRSHNFQPTYNMPSEVCTSFLHLSPFVLVKFSTPIHHHRSVMCDIFA